MYELSVAAMEARARRASKRVGLSALKRKWRIGTVDNRGGFQLLDPYSNRIVAGSRFDLTAEDVIKYCRALQ
jgi:hypothetical protein